MDEINKFINEYSERDFSKIDFKRDIDTGDDWVDLNASFREKICDRVFNEGIKTQDLLLKDLFRIEAVYSRECWGSSMYVSSLGKRLLEQTKDKYIEDYLIGKHESFDTECSVSLGDVSKELLQEVVTIMKQTKAQCTEAAFTKQEAIVFIEEYIERTFK